MIIRSLCNSCFQPFELLIQPSDVELVKQLADEEGHTAPCPRLCGGRINLVGDPNIDGMRSKLKEPIHVTGLQLFQAVNGLGLPDEVPKDEVTIDSILKTNRVLSIDLDRSGDSYYLLRLKLENGISIHFTGSPRGARVLKITKEKADVSPEHSR